MHRQGLKLFDCLVDVFGHLKGNGLFVAFGAVVVIAAKETRKRNGIFELDVPFGWIPEVLPNFLLIFSRS